MEMKKCPNGHYYDASIHAACPYCSGANNSGSTLPLDNFSQGGSATMPLTGAMPAGDSDRTMPLQAAMNNSDSDDGRTVALIKEDKGIDPVVGWLVCIEGKEKGRDYRVHADNNFIGRSDRMDICIRGDETISRENHAILSYDTVENTFFFSPGDGRAIVRVNGKAVFQTVELAPYDELTIGKTIVKFMPFCSKDFVW